MVSGVDSENGGISPVTDSTKDVDVWSEGVLLRGRVGSVAFCSLFRLASRTASTIKTTKTTTRTIAMPAITPTGALWLFSVAFSCDVPGKEVDVCACRGIITLNGYRDTCSKGVGNSASGGAPEDAAIARRVVVAIEESVCDFRDVGAM